MFLFRYAIQSLKKQGIRTPLIIIQLLIGFIALTISYSLIDGVNKYVSDIKKTSKPTDILLINKISNKEISNDNLLNFYNSILANDNIDKFGTFIVSDRTVEIKGSKEKIKAVFVDKHFIDLYPFRVQKGLNIMHSDFQDGNGPIPILVGSKLSESLPIGSVIQFLIPDDRIMSGINKQLKVVGVLEKDTLVWKGGRTHLDDGLIYNEPIIVIPMQREQDYGEQLKLRITTNMFLRLKDPGRLSEFKDYIKKESLNFSIISDPTTIEEQIKYIYKQSISRLLPTIIIAAMFLLLSVFGLLGVVLYSITSREKEFGIRYAIGATPKSIANLICSEIIALYIISSILSILIVIPFYLFVKQQELIYIGINTIIKVMITSLVLSIISCIIPFMRVTKSEPVNLIGGK